MDVYAQAVTPAKRKVQGESGCDAAGHREEDELKIIVSPARF
jgi:hypothetical protein